MIKLRILDYLILFSIGLLLSVNIYPTQAERHAEFLETNFTFSPKYFKNFSLYLANQSLNMEMDLLRPIQRGFKVHIEYQLRMANANNYQTIFTRSFDICATISSIKDGLFKSWFKSITKHGNFMENCPVEVGQYYMHDWHMGSLYHKFLYPGKYRCNANFFYGKYETKTENRVLSVVLVTLLSD